MLVVEIEVHALAAGRQSQSAEYRDDVQGGLCHAQAFALPAVVLAIPLVDGGLLRARVHGGARVVLEPAVVERGAAGWSDVVVIAMRSRVKVVHDGAN